MAKKKPAKKQDPGPSIVIRTIDGDAPKTSNIAEKSVLQQLAMKWCYRMENRSRWARMSASAETMEEEAKGAMTAWGFGTAALEHLAQADVAEICVPFIGAESSKDDGWETRIFPWEYIVTAATSRLRAGRRLTVVRHLRRADADDGKPTGSKPTTLVNVQSSPGKLIGNYDFGRERQLVESSCDLKTNELLCHPTREQLAKAIKSRAGKIVHVSAVDSRLAAELLTSDGANPEIKAEMNRRGSPWRYDGLVLKKETGEGVDVVRAWDVAELLTSGAVPPVFVGFNVWNSAGRIAALTVAQGARAAIGFQTTFDDALAELFFANFYQTLRLGGWSNFLQAFQTAWHSLPSRSSELTGTGVVLWSDTSLFTPTPTPKKLQALSATKPRLLSFVDDREQFEFEIKPLRRLNYSLLHNHCSLFEKLSIYKMSPGTLRNVRIEVELLVGNEVCRYLKTFDLDQPVVDLAQQIVLPLTSALVRRVDENLQSSLHIRISNDETVMYEDTHRVTLLPIDLWQDSDEERHWLPSFVLPRDPAITRIIQEAQKYLSCLVDDPVAGFDGYQSQDAYENWVELQVRAIWTALVQNLPLSYVNPPPSYEPGSQRLRTPTQIMSSLRGTCIDLSLLLAACLEYIDIYPVIFLLEGHAFPGYWVSDDGYLQFCGVQLEPEETREKSSLSESREQSSSSSKTPAPWLIGKSSYREILEYIKQGHLVPIESVSMTGLESFQAAVEAGHENLRSRREFHSMIDVRLARDNESNPVTPLPIGDSL